MQPNNPGQPSQGQNQTSQQQAQQPVQGQPVSPYPTMPSATTNLPIAQPKKDGPPVKLFAIPLVLVILLLLGTLGYAYNLSSENDSIRQNVTQIIEEQVKEEKKTIRRQMEAEFLEREKSPYRSYKTPAEYGAVKVTYPKTWAAYVEERESSKEPIDGRFHPNFVPGLKSGVALALKLDVINEQYSEVLSDYSSGAGKGVVRVSPFKLKKVPKVLGSRIDGEIIRGYQGSAVIFPLRDKTIRVSTLTTQFVPDFNKIILPNLQFTP